MKSVRLQILIKKIASSNYATNCNRSETRKKQFNYHCKTWTICCGWVISGQLSSTMTIQTFHLSDVSVYSIFKSFPSLFFIHSRKSLQKHYFSGVLECHQLTAVVCFSTTLKLYFFIALNNGKWEGKKIFIKIDCMVTEPKTTEEFFKLSSELMQMEVIIRFASFGAIF